MEHLYDPGADPSRDIEQLLVHNSSLQQTLDATIQKKRELRARTGSLYARNARLRHEIAQLRERLFVYEAGGNPDMGGLQNGVEQVTNKLRDFKLEPVGTTDDATKDDATKDDGMKDDAKTDDATNDDATDANDVAANEGHSGRASTKVVIFKPRIAMTPVVAIAGSRYVGVDAQRGQYWQHVEEAAYVQESNGSVSMACKFVLNESFVPKVKREAVNLPTLTYIGMQYPDDTSLCYLPVPQVAIQYRSRIGRVTRVTVGDESWKVVYGGDYVRIGMNRMVFSAISTKAVQACSDAGHHGAVVLAGNRVETDSLTWFDAGLTPSATVVMMGNNAYMKRRVGAALRQRKKDICGKALLYVRLSLKPGASSVESLSFKLQTAIEDHTDG